MCINSLPTISVEKPPQKVVYLDTNMMIEMARAQNGKCNNTYAEQIAKTYQVLTSMMTKKYILCPLGNQFSEMRNARMRQSSTKFLFHFTNSDFLSPAKIEHTQLDIGYEAFTARSQIIELNCASYFTPNILSSSPYRIVISPKYSPANAELFRIEKIIEQRFSTR